MEIRQSVFGEIAIHSGAQVSGVDFGNLLRRLLLFDTVTVKSVRLREIPFVVRTFGKTGFLQLLESGVLKISCEFTSIITGFARNGVRSLPLSHFKFGVVDAAERETTLKAELRSLQGIPGLGNAAREAMEATILTGLIRPPSDYGAQIRKQIESDLRTNSPALKAAITEQAKIRGATGDDGTLEVRVEETQDRVFHVITNLTNNFGMSEQAVHDILEPSISAVARLNQRLADMKSYSAITGFADTDAPLLFGKLAGIIAPLNPRPIEEQFRRVVTIADIPECVPGKRINVDSLLKVRESAECREFRAWLTRIEDVGDAEIAEMVGGIRNKCASLLQSGPGRALRFVATSGIGLIPYSGMIAGPIAGAVDSFLVERMFPTSGPFAFLTKTYPSLFE